MVGLFIKRYADAHNARKLPFPQFNPLTETGWRRTARSGLTLSPMLTDTF